MPKRMTIYHAPRDGLMWIKHERVSVRNISMVRKDPIAIFWKSRFRRRKNFFSEPTRSDVTLRDRTRETSEYYCIYLVI